jgi:signal transduction histidine kinase
MDAAAESVRGSIRSLRSLLVDIYPPDFDEVSLESALTDLVGRAQDADVAVHLDLDDLQDPLPDHVARLVYRVAQEGLRNVLEHAGATAVTIRVANEGQGAVAEVVDDGRGIDEASATDRQASGHLGLTALRGIVADAGGTLTVESAPGAGTRLRATVPVR